MKKITLTTCLLILTLQNVWAEGEDETSSTAPTVTQSDAPRVMPTPQQTRIAGLIERLSTNHAHEIETLEADGESFLGLFREAETGDPQGCLILLHGDHGHPDWPQVVSPLRETLPRHSWCTLAIEIPDMGGRATPVQVGQTTNNETSDTDENDANADASTSAELPNEAQVFARIDAAIALTQEKGYNQVAYLGYRSGAAYALRYAAEQGITSQALVLIEPRSTTALSDFQLAQNIERLRLPTLDYYFDRTNVDARFARQRLAAANKRGNQRAPYIQIDALPDARFDPTGNKRLTQRVWGFLKQNTLQSNQRKTLPEFEKSLFYESPLD